MVSLLVFLFINGMLSSVDLYDNLFLITNKVHYIFAYRLLPSEF